MPRTRPIKTNFSRGEIDPKAQMRSDITAFENGADKIRNAVVFPQGGIRRRDGLEFVDTLPPANDPVLPATPISRVLDINNVQMIEFKFSLDQLYLLVLTVEILYIYRDDILIFEVAHPYLEAEVPFVNFTGSLDTVLLFHPNHEVRKLQRLGADSSWSIITFTITNPTTLVFNNSAIGSVTPSAVTGAAITLTFGTAQDGTNEIGRYVRGNGGFARIDARTSDTLYTAEVLSDFTDTTAIKQGFWTKEEDAFSATRGWPVSGVLFQGRLCIAGTKDSPQLFATSRSGIIEDFFAGNADADSGIVILGDSEKITIFDQIRVGRHLLIFGDDSEWYVPISEGTPITPANSTLRKTSSVGSKRGVRTEEVDGVVYFLQRGGGALREFVFTDKETAYAADTVSLLASHLVGNPVDICLRKSLNTDEANYIWHVNTDGTLAVFCVLRSEDVNAWSLLNTAGSFVNCAVLDQTSYFVVDRTIDSVAVKFIEKFRRDLRYDAGVIRPFFSFLSLPGVSGNYASTPDATALDIVGDIDLRVEVALDDWIPSGAQIAISKWLSSGDDRGYNLDINTNGKPRFSWSTDGTNGNKVTVQATAATSFVNGTKHWLRVTLDVDAGSTDNDVTFYTSDDGVSWTQLGDVVNTAGVTSIFNATQPLEVGKLDATHTAGKFFRAQVLDGIDGTVVFDVDFTKLPVGTTSFAESSTQAAIVTINQSGSPEAEIVTGGTADFAIDLEHLANETVELTLDNAFQGEFVVSALGVVTFPRTAVTSWQLGLSFPLVEGETANQVLIRTLPADLLLPEGSTMGKKKRIVNVSTRVVDTETFLINGNRVPTRKFGPSLLDVPITKVSGEFEIRGLRGYNRKGQIDISQEQPFAMTVLGLAYDIAT